MTSLFNFFNFCSACSHFPAPPRWHGYLSFPRGILEWFPLHSLILFQSCHWFLSYPPHPLSQLDLKWPQHLIYPSLFRVIHPRLLPRVNQHGVFSCTLRNATLVRRPEFIVGASKGVGNSQGAHYIVQTKTHSHIADTPYNTHTHTHSEI